MNLAGMRDELQHLDWRQPQQWSAAMRQALATAATVTMAVLVTLTLIVPALDALGQVRHQEQQAQQTLQELQQQLIPLQQQFRQQAALRDLHAQLWPPGDNRGGGLSLLQILGTLRDRHGLRDEGVEPPVESELKSELGAYQVCRVSVHLSGGYHALAGLLSELATLPQMLLLERLDLQRVAGPTPEAAPTLAITLVLSAVQLREPTINLDHATEGSGS